MSEPDSQPADKPQTPSSEPPTQGTDKLKDAIAVAVACLALTGFGVFILALLFMLDLEEVRWARATFLLNGVEAVAFAAAGYLFGREVNRGRAENAEELARSETERAEKAEEQGQTLADEILGAASLTGPRAAFLERVQPDERLEHLAGLAEALFPRRGTRARR
jgi:hypothetical protein